MSGIGVRIGVAAIVVAYFLITGMIGAHERRVCLATYSVETCENMLR